MSRDLIADSIELAVFGHRLDGLVTLAGCDKTLPGCLMAIARLNLPSVFIYGGSILPGTYQGQEGHRSRASSRRSARTPRAT